MNTPTNAAMRPSDASIAKAFEESFDGDHRKERSECGCEFCIVIRRARELDAAQAGSGEGDAVDAARYRFLRGEGPEVVALWDKALADTSLTLENLDREVDVSVEAARQRMAAIAQQNKRGGA